MKRFLLIPILSLALMACSDNDRPGDDGPAVELPAIAAGTHNLRLAGDAEGGQATAFVGSDGSGYLLLGADSDEPTAVVYKRSGAAARWQRVPTATGDLSLTTQRSEALPAQAFPALATLAGNYEARVAGQVARFSLSAAGAASGTSGACGLGGTLDPAKAIGNALQVALTLTDCGAASGSYSGIGYVDPDAENATLRVVMDDGIRVQDLYLFKR